MVYTNSQEVSVFHLNARKALYGAALVALLATLGAAEEAVAQNGTAIVRVESRMDHPDVQFSFVGAFQGTIGIGETLQEGVSSGTHSIAQPAPSPWLTLVDVSCDDQESAVPSSGSVAMRAANFHIDGGETVTCTFVYDSFERFILPDELPSGAGQVPFPKEGVWGVTNFTGTMQCPGLVSRELRGEDYNRGTLHVLESGARLFGEAHEDHREDMTLFRVPEIPGRYAGWAVDTYEGQTVIVHSVIQWVTDEWFVGYGFSDMRAEGMHCRLYQPFEMHWEEPKPDNN